MWSYIQTSPGGKKGFGFVFLDFHILEDNEKKNSLTNSVQALYN